MSRERVLQVFRGRLARLPISRHPGLLFNPWIEGYRDHTFGGRAGPSVAASNIFHELGHAAQFGVEQFRKRGAVDGFVFKVPKVFVFDRYCEEPKTSQATLRELETFAYQMHLMRAAGYKMDDEQFVAYSARLMRFMPDWYHIPGKNEEGRAAWCKNRIERFYARLARKEPLDRLEAWLDATWKRLRRSDAKERRAYHQVETRYRVEGLYETAH